jgi:protocatechuate 3,4-dioxygenase beta subunit
MSRLLACGVLLSCSLPAIAQDLEFLRALEDAQRARPEQLAPSARIAPESEPGTPLVVHGRAFDTDGRTPLADAVVFAYHTDREGHYDRRGAPAHSWRLRGWAKTGADGRFEFRTIRPAPYPGRQISAHIHLTLYTADGAGYHAGGVEFEDDPWVAAAQREETRKDAIFGPVRAVRVEGSVQHVDVHLRVVPDERFRAPVELADVVRHADGGRWEQCTRMLPELLAASADHREPLVQLGRRARAAGTADARAFLDEVVIPTLLDDERLEDADRVQVLRQIFGVDVAGSKRRRG